MLISTCDKTRQKMLRVGVIWASQIYIFIYIYIYIYIHTHICFTGTAEGKEGRAVLCLVLCLWMILQCMHVIPLGPDILVEHTAKLYHTANLIKHITCCQHYRNQPNSPKDASAPQYSFPDSVLSITSASCYKFHILETWDLLLLFSQVII